MVRPCRRPRSVPAFLTVSLPPPLNTPMQNIQKADTFPLGRLFDQIRDGRFVIPDFQREFAWGAWDVRDLVQSVFLDYYIGNLLLWKSTKHNVEALACEPLFGFGGSLHPEYIVLDGQQRLTALHYAFFQPDRDFPGRKNPYLFFLRIDRYALDRDDDEAFFYYRKTNYYARVIIDRESQYREHLMPLTVFTDQGFDQRDWLDGYAEFWRQAARQPEAKLHEHHAELLAQADALNREFRNLTRDYNVSYITLEADVELAKVCEIFTKINARGVRLDTFDLLNAITKPKGLRLKAMHREAVAALPNDYPSLNTKSYILMVMSIVEQTYCSPKYLYYLVPGAVKQIRVAGKREEVTLIHTPEAFETKWNAAVTSLTRGITALKNSRSYGALRESFLPYPSIVPIFSVLLEKVRAGDKIEDPVSAHQKLKEWYWASVFGERYSSSVESTSAADFQSVSRWLSGGDAPKAVTDFAQEVANVDFLALQQTQSARYRAVFNLMIIAGASDWQHYGLPEDGDLDDHHIVPRAQAKRLGLGDEINSVLNRVPISSATNRHIIRDRLPNDYLAEMFANSQDAQSVYATLDSHLISREATDILLRTPFGKTDFEEFLAERERVVRERVLRLVR